MAVISFKCPNCDGELIFDPETQKYKCEYCGSKFTQAELDALQPAESEETDAGAADGSDEAEQETTEQQSADTKKKEGEDGGAEAVIYNCPSCGAEIVTDATTAATFCYYCHNPVMLGKRLEGKYLPNKVIPFKISKKEAEKRFLEYVGKKKFVPKAYEARVKIGTLDMDIKNKVLNDAADNLLKAEKEILEANKRDVATAEENMKAKSMIDRLSLDHDRLLGMADGLRQIAKLADPIGEVMSMAKRPNGLIIGKRRVAIGVVGIIFEARPNVTSDAFGLCFKTGNCVILKGGSDAINTNIAIVKALKKALTDNLVSAAALALIESTDRETTNAFMKMDQYVDVLIPRGGAGLIQNVVKNATIPVIQTGTGNCHVYVDKDADFDMAVNIINNAKTQRISVCNACESIVVHSAIAEEFLPKLYDKLREHHVQLRCDERAQAILAGRDDVTEAASDDWGMEYLDYIMSVKIVDSIDEAIEHINRYNTSHSEAIVTNDYDNAQKFLNEIDAACVYVNASTRFSDGNEFGFGAEIGISTQKLHARGPMGLEALTSYKYIIYGNGQIRE